MQFRAQLFNISIFIIVFSISASGQSYLRMIDQGTYSVREIQDSAYAYFKDTDKGRGTGYKQFKRWEYNALRMMNEDGYLSTSEEQIAELERYQAEQLSQGHSRVRTEDNWVDMGPNAWNATSGWNPGVGRITGMAMDPRNENHILTAGETGGVWKSMDGGQSWVPLCDYFSNMQVHSVAMHPTDSDTYFFGSTNGRIYKSTDAGATWQALENAGESLINKILIHPDNPDIMFACSQWTGLYRSTDGGKSWERKTNDPNSFDVEFKAGDYNTIFASGTSFHRSFDGGETFSSIQVLQNLQILAPSNLAGSFVATESGFNPGFVGIPNFPDHITSNLALFKDAEEGSFQGCAEAANPDELEGKIVLVKRGNCNFATKVLNAQRAGAIAVLIYNNAPGNFTIGGGDAEIVIPALSIEGNFGDGLAMLILDETEIEIRLQKPDASNISNGPKLIAVTPANPELIYMLEVSGRIFGGFYKSTNGGETFLKLDHSGKNYFGYSTDADDDRGQAPRNMDVAVHPERPDEVHIAGILTWISKDGGVTFNATSDWIPSRAANKNIGYNHADVEFLEFHGTTLFTGSDGGLYKAENTDQVNENYYQDLTAGLGIRQFYRIGISQTNPVIVSGGSQDNGTSLYSEKTGWIDWLGADGMETFVDKNDPEIVYGTSQYGSLYRSRNGGFSYNGLNTDKEGNWVTPFEQDPVVSNKIYVGYNQLLVSDNQGSNWETKDKNFGVNLDHIKISPADNDIIFVAHGNVLEKSTDGGDTWEVLNSSQGLINSIALHPTNPEKIAIATNSTNKVFISINGGLSWQAYRKNLPNFSALAIVWHDGPEEGLYLGMNYGIYYIDNNLTEWLPYNNFLPNVIVNELEINYVDGMLYAATYGRGLWASPLYSGLASSTTNTQLVNYQVFPNPANDFVSINFENNKALKSEIRLFDHAGRLHRYIKQVDSFPYKLDVSNLPAGVYYIRVNNTEGHSVQKIVLSK